MSDVMHVKCLACGAVYEIHTICFSVSPQCCPYCGTAVGDTEPIHPPTNETYTEWKRGYTSRTRTNTIGD